MVDIHVREPKVDRRIEIGPITYRPDNEYAQPSLVGEGTPHELRTHSAAMALNQFESSLPSAHGDLAGLRAPLLAVAAGRSMNVDGIPFDGSHARMEMAKSAEAESAFAAERRRNPRFYQTVDETGSRRDFIDPRELVKSGALSKSILDVGTSQNYANGNVNGGQSLGFFSLDTKMARGTVRPDSFTFYQMLAKSAAYQVVDYWPYIDDPGGALPGSATSGFSNVQSGTLGTSAGIYALQSVNLKLMLDGRAVTLALMAQNNFVSINEQENANAALTVLGTADWLNYHGNSAIFPNQFNGITTTTPTANIFDFQAFYNTNAALQGWSTSQTLFNMIYEASAVITSWGRFGRITHALMTPTTAGALQSLVTTLLNQVTNFSGGGATELVVNGDLQGMRTRFGPIQFPMDALITARDIAAQGQPRSNGTTPATTTGPTPPTGVVAAASGTSYAASNWGVSYQGTATAFVAAGTQYYYAVASADVNMNESVLAYSNILAGSGITSSGAVVLSIAGPAAADATAYRVFRSGAKATTAVSGSPTAYRFIGTATAAGTGTVTFIDYNGRIPGSESIYLLDLRQEDNALDFRYLLPMTRIELFAQNLYMPWAVASIGALRNRIPRFHGIVSNFVPDNPVWNPLGVNA